MKLKKYSKYKNSGIDWIGEIPEDREIMKIKHFAKTVAGGTPSTANESFWEGKIPWLPSGMIHDNTIEEDKVFKFISFEALNNSSTKWIKPNSVLIALTGATCGNIGYLPFKATANQSVIGIETNKVDSMYLFYYLLTQKEQILINQTGGAQGGINQENVRDIFCSIPLLKNQQKISSFLDSKTLQIEKLIEKDRNLIELLKEKRVSLINQAVTKGIEKNVKIKDSGIEWIGKIPESWEVGPLKYYMNISGGYAFSSEDFSDDGIQLIRIGNLYLNNLDLNRQPIFLPNSFKKQHREFLIKKGDILLSLTGTLGKKDYGYAILVEGDEDYFLNQRVGRLNSKNNLLNYYAIYLLQSEFYLNQIYLLPSGSKQANLSNEQVLSPIVMIPSIQEQQEIVSFLDKKTVKIDNHVKKVERRIELYEEYKKSLIYNVVTGKVEV